MKSITILACVICALIAQYQSSNAQNDGDSLKVAWKFSGRVQLQHMYNADINETEEDTQHGFRVRRGRIVSKAAVGNYVNLKFQLEVRDKNPVVKDAYGTVKFLDYFQASVGQFKVPVWREELRSSSKLLLIERSPVAKFLDDVGLTAQHVGVELGAKTAQGITFALNYSNGSGAASNELAGTEKDGDINNGKLLTGRINVPIGDRLEIGVSGASNQAGQRISDLVNNLGTISAVAPDFALKIPLADNQRIDLEGGAVLGRISKSYLETDTDQIFRMFDLTSVWKSKLTDAGNNFANIDGLELALGIAFVDPHQDVVNDELYTIRFGPAASIGKFVRLQLNAEVVVPENNHNNEVLAVRSQLQLAL